MALHRVTAHLLVEAPDWEEAEEEVRMLPSMLGPTGCVSIEAVKWEETVEEDDEEEDDDYDH